MAAEETTKDDVVYVLDIVKSGGESVGLAPTPKAEDLDELMNILSPEEIFKLAYSQLRTNHQNMVRAKFNSKGKNATGVIAAIAAGTVLVEDIKTEMVRSDSNFTDAATKLMRTEPDPTVIHWDVLS